jgi:hypothetical protein
VFGVVVEGGARNSEGWLIRKLGCSVSLKALLELLEARELDGV